MSEIRATTISDLAGTGPATLTGQYAAKAWVNFNGTGTVAVRESENVSSITDLGTGAYTVNFTTAMPDINYAPVATCTHAAGIVGNGIISFYADPIGTVSAVSFYTAYTDAVNPSAAFDPLCVAVVITR
jgi:hypothetical protein